MDTRRSLDRSVFVEEPDTIAYIEQFIGFDKLTLKAAKQALKVAKKHDGKGDLDLSGVIDELEEIVDDLKFTKNPKNAIITWVHDHHAELEAKVLESYDVEGLMIRAHVDRRYLMIVGKSKAPVDGIEELVEQLSGFAAKSVVTVVAS